MTVEIRELHIKAVVGTDSPDHRSPNAQRRTDSDDERERLIALCVERVLEVIEKNDER
jgi:hypothetical protein